jgi:hypothetical protein
MLLTLGLLLALIPAVLCGEGPARELTRLGLLVDTSKSTPGTVLEAFRSETERVLPIPGLDIQWRRAGDHTGAESFDRLIVVRLVGECLPHKGSASHDGGPLGVTHISDGRILPFVEADCGRIVRASQRLRRHPFRLRAEELGRALGRVIAHEVYHVLSASSWHDDQGLSKSSLSAMELFLPGIEFVPAALDRMAAGLPGRTLQAAAVTAVSGSP